MTSEPHDRDGFTRVTLGGRAYPTGERAVEALRRALAKDGIEVPDENVWSVLVSPGAICPYTARALVPKEVYDALRK